MNINAKFLQEAIELEKKWGKSCLLDGIQKRFSRSTTAVLLESQRLFNEVPTGNVWLDKSNKTPEFKKVNLDWHF